MADQSSGGGHRRGPQQRDQGDRRRPRPSSEPSGGAADRDRRPVDAARRARPRPRRPRRRAAPSPAAAAIVPLTSAIVSGAARPASSTAAGMRPSPRTRDGRRRKTAPRRDAPAGRRRVAVPGHGTHHRGTRRCASATAATVAVDGLSFTVRAGEVTGFVGPNGAGKSTTMRLILGLDAPDEGEALVGGRPYRSLRTPLTQVGALLDAAALHPGRRGPRPPAVAGAQQRHPGSAGSTRCSTRSAWPRRRRRRAGGFSLGMRQRLGIAAALLGDPPVLMFDEPVNGLDPEGIVWIRGLLRSLAAEGRAVLVSSHLMSELEDTADHLIVIGRGRLIADTSVAELLAAASEDRVEVRTAQRAEAMTRAGQRRRHRRRGRRRTPLDRRRAARRAGRRRC